MLKETRLDKFRNIDIYPVISSEFTNGQDPLSVLEKIAEGGARIVQLREKNKSKQEIWELALKYRELTDRYSMLLIINDHLDIALASNADGVHLGQDDLPLEAALKIAPELIIGISTHSEQEALRACQSGAGYINIGPIFPTQTKTLSYPAIGLENLKAIASKIEIPFTVMGGIKAANIPELKSCGASRIAMVTEITRATDITQKVRELRELF
jgi:thiamine-phosphate pyrophosphorylase